MTADDQASDLEMMDREICLKNARAVIPIIPVIPCEETCDTGPYGKDCEDYRFCVEDWVKRTTRGTK